VFIYDRTNHGSGEEEENQSKVDEIFKERGQALLPTALQQLLHFIHNLTSLNILKFIPRVISLIILLLQNKRKMVDLGKKC